MNVFELLAAWSSRPDARPQISIVPYLGIVWDDEVPPNDVLRSLADADQRAFWRLFGIRVRLWHGADLKRVDRVLWDEAKAAAPDHGRFQRMTRSAEELADDEREINRALQ